MTPFGFRNAIECFRMYIARMCEKRAPGTVSILSVGAGNSATEINIAEWLRENAITNYRFECLDLNAEVLKRGRISAEAKGLLDHFTFSSFDVNSWKAAHSYDIVLAIQSLHHFVELELLFEKIWNALSDDGYFMSDDMIGRNGHQRWPEALKFVNELWRELPDKYKYNHGLKRFEKKYDNWDCSAEGFEGIRAQDILPLLIKRFNFELFVAFGNIIDIFVDRCFGPNFDITNETDLAFIDRVQALDQTEIESGRVKPTHMLAVMTKMPVTQPKINGRLSPEFCVRRP
jgi:SAM-dependent methyltransferase